jgi:hypothetical protein
MPILSQMRRQADGEAGGKSAKIQTRVAIRRRQCGLSRANFGVQ